MDITVKINPQKPLLTSPSPGMTAIIKAVGTSCNLKCDYCFFHNEDQSYKQVMSRAVLSKFTTEYLQMFDGNIQFIWHGGEPLLAGIGFYREAVSLQNLHKKTTHRIQNLIQTNGTLINAEWAVFFKENDFKVGISLDGFEKCHNKFRKDTQGTGTFHNVIGAIKILDEHGVMPGIIQTIPKSSLGYTKENFDFLTENLGLKKIGLNIFCDTEYENPLMRDESLNNDDFFYLYQQYFDLWLTKNDPDLVIREIECLIYGLLGKCSNYCANSGTCTSYITVNWDGRITPACERLLHTCSDLAMNIKTSDLIDIINSKERLEFASKVNTLPGECDRCEWLAMCYNGCTSHRLGGVSGKYAYCEGQKRILSYLKHKLETLTNSNN